MAKSNERTVVLAEVNEADVGRHIEQQQKNDGNITLGSIGDAIPQFIKVEDYTTFTAEYALQDGNIIVHFFLPPDLRGPHDYWTMRFPRALDTTARAYFIADRPRLQAKYTTELASWWFKAHSYDHIVNITRFVRGFFDALDAALEGQA